MARKTYDEATKSAIVNAAQSARAAGKSWAETFEAAKEAGYTGSAPGIQQMLRAAGKKAAKTATESAKPERKKRERSAKIPAQKHGRHMYDETTKAAIVKAVADARNAGKKWPEALKAATAAGYRGGLVPLTLFVKRAGITAQKRRIVPQHRAVALTVGGLKSIEQMVERLVQERVHAALDRAISELKKAQC